MNDDYDTIGQRSSPNPFPPFQSKVCLHDEQRQQIVETPNKRYRQGSPGLLAKYLYALVLIIVVGAIGLGIIAIRNEPETVRGRHSLPERMAHPSLRTEPELDRGSDINRS